MNIGLITGEYPPMQGGIGDFTRELARALSQLGHAVHVITRTACGDDSAPHQAQQTAQASPALQRRSNVFVHPVVPHWGWRSYTYVMNVVRHFNLKVLNIQYQAAAYDLHPAINFFPVRHSFSAFEKAKPRPAVVVTFHDLKVPYLFPKAGPLRDWVVTLLARRADATIATNRGDEEELRRRGIRRVERIPIGSNISPHVSDDLGRYAWRSKLALGPDDFLLGFFGFFNARKGVETLVRALGLLQGANRASLRSRSTHLLFVGGTLGSSDPTNRAYADQIHRLIADLGLVEHVHYTGYLPEAEISAAFAAIDLCVLPYADGVSFHHGTLMAALAHHRPIVSTRPSIKLPELVHGENVWLVPPQDPEATASAISELSIQPERLQRLSQGAANLARQFRWERIAARTAELFESANRET
jgi:glycosyltransferase involved in cell wall biosynthesis